MKQILLPAYLNGFRKRADSSASVSFVTQEVPSSVYSEFADLQGEFGWLGFRMSETDAPEIPTNNPERTEKSKSKILRSFLFRLWEAQNHSIPFDQYYDLKMDSIIDAIKTEIHGTTI